MLQGKMEELSRVINGQFYSRTAIEGKKAGVDFGITLSISSSEDTTWFTFTKGEESHTVHIPNPYIENGAILISQNEVRRALCPFLVKAEDVVLDYYAVMFRIFCAETTGLIPVESVKKIPFIQHVIYGFNNGNASIAIYNLQKAIGEVLAKMPLHETYMNSWVMNHRLIIIDPTFDAIISPEHRLDYQAQKNREYFPRGWTSIGMSDGSLADKNYILTYDIRKLTPFGLRFHNPQRNLFQTLGMKGDHLPQIRSQSMQDLMDVGITRKGWNLFTLFADVPDVFEDQIMVDSSLANFFITYEKRYQCFGVVKVKAGDIIKKGHTLSISDLGVAKVFDINASRSVVKKVTPGHINIGGVLTPVFNVVVEYRRRLRDGVKITNLHGNKGVIRMKNLGFAIDPRSGKTRKIQVIVSAKSIKKRKNFGQLFEALLNNVTPNDKKPVVLPDAYEVPMERITDRLKAEGFPEDGTWMCETYVGGLTGVCGEIFWGVTKSVENALWDDEATIVRNNRELRTAGLKFSHVEMRALETRFGKENPILDEILSYAQGHADLNDELDILNAKRGVVPSGVPVHDILSLKFVNQASGTIISEDLIKGTVVDENFEPEGFVMQLPIVYQVAINTKGEVEAEGYPADIQGMKAVYRFDKVYVPKAALRRCWRHDTGKYGLSEIGVLVNNMVVLAHRFAAEQTSEIAIRLFYNSIRAYFHKMAMMMGTKKGEVSTLGMSVRYPMSAKAVATLSNSLPKNTVEIHESMADALNVQNGDIILVERFPCLGFMSLRPQRVRISHDEMCRYTIRSSGNCLCSLGLDFDGDVLFLASFHTPEAKELLHKEWKNPNERCYEVILELNSKVGAPRIKCMGLQEYKVTPFGDLDNETHAELVLKATGVKSHTGPVIALAYNIMRILENSSVKDDGNTNVAIEVFLDRVANTVFKQKHGVKSLHSIVMDAICMANVETLVEHGFERSTSTIICNTIIDKAKSIGVSNLVEYAIKAKERGWSNIITRIVRLQNKIYFASRANLEAIALLEHLEAEAVDVPSRMFKRVISGKIPVMKNSLSTYFEERALKKVKSEKVKEACAILFNTIDSILDPEESARKGYAGLLYTLAVNQRSARKEQGV